MRDNHYGIKGWIYAGNFGLERYLYLLQRLSGLCLLFYLGLHLFVTAVRLDGAAAWTAAMACHESRRPSPSEISWWWRGLSSMG